jgi:WD40 repeat protein
MLVVESRLIMRGRVFLVLSALILCSWSGIPEPLQDDVLESSVPSNQQQSWNQPNGPIWQSGWSSQIWQPQPTGMLWEVDFSPDGQMIAAVDLSTNLLTVWNSSDGRVIFHAPNANSLVDVVWLDNSHVLVADIGSYWYSYEILDDGGAWPMNSTSSRTGRWTADLTGNYDGSLWGLDITRDRSRITFCGKINDPNIGGEVVVANTLFFIDGSPPDSAHVYTNDWGTDCAISENGTFVAALSRVAGLSAGTYHDTVTGWDVQGSTLGQSWTRNVAGGEAMAWAIDFSPQGNTYTIGYNRPNEGVITDFFHESGAINWYAPIPQNISSVRWSPDGSGLGVGLLNPGRLLMMDSVGGILSDYGWHGTVWNNNPYPSDITAVAIDDQGLQYATSGKDGAIEIHTIDSQLELTIHRRLSSDYLREIDIHPEDPFVAFAESNGVATVRDYRSGGITRQCFHPDFDQPIDEYPFAKSVVLIEQFIIVGFSDGTIVTCADDGKEVWHWRIDQYHPEMVAFGRIDIHPIQNLLAISWTQNSSTSGVAGKVTILDIDQMNEVIGWDYSTEYWTMEFSNDGAWLASTGQDGSVRLWQTEDPDPTLWADQGIQYNHSNYTGVATWHKEIHALLTAGWDGQAIIWDADSGQEILNFQFTDEAFGGGFVDGSHLIVASGDASNSASGQLEFYDGPNMTQLGTWEVGGIPRGFVVDHSGGLIVANHTSSWWLIIPDSDGDGVIDDNDAFPQDPLQWIDTDGDGYGDNNAPGAGGDGCPTTWGTSSIDRGGCPDSDGDQWSDPDANWPECVLGAGYGDAWPANPDQWCDSDGDAFGDQYDFEIDSTTGLRTNETGDAFPNDITQWRDRDADGIGDNYSYNIGTDGFRTNQQGDAFPNNHLQFQDTDGDGWGDIYSWVEDMVGLRIEEGDAFPLDPLAWSDIDGDGCPTASDSGLTIDNHPEDATRCDEPLDFDLPSQLNIDGVGNEETWTISVDWKSTIEGTDSVSIYGLSWNATEGMEHLLLNIEPPGAIAWWIENEPDSNPTHDLFERTRESNHDRLTLRLISTSNDGQTLEYWVNSTYEIESGEESEPEPEPTCVEDETRPAGDDCNDCVCVMGPNGGEWACTEKACSQTGDASSSEGLSPIAWSVIIIGLLAALVLGLLFMRRSSDSAVIVESTSSGVHAPCTSCGGPAHETVNNGNRWTWCPVCRQWLNYLGNE